MRTTDLTPSEFNEYYTPYINKVGGQTLIEALEAGGRKTVAFFKAIPGEKHEYKYADGKWTPKELLLHLIDTERNFAYRALSFARSGNTELPGFDQDEYAASSNANLRSFKSLLIEYEAVRASSLSMFTSFSNDVLAKHGIASGNKLSVRAAGFIIAGHEKHHKEVITERYLLD